MNIQELTWISWIDSPASVRLPANDMKGQIGIIPVAFFLPIIPIQMVDSERTLLRPQNMRTCQPAWGVKPSWFTPFTFMDYKHYRYVHDINDLHDVQFDDLLNSRTRAIFSIQSPGRSHQNRWDSWMLISPQNDGDSYQPSAKYCHEN